MKLLSTIFKSSTTGVSRPVLSLVLGAFFVFAILRCDGEETVFSPSIELSCPPDTVLCGMPCTVSWSGSDRDGNVDGYYYGLDDDSPETWTTAEACTLLDLEVGRHLFFVQAQDNDGRRSAVASCVLFVEQAPCRVAPAIIDFGAVDLGAVLDSVFTISNVSQGVLSGEIGGLCDGFEILSGGGPYTLSAGETYDVTVRFSPGACGPAECFVSTGLGDCPAVTCLGEGAGTACSVSPASLDFGALNIGGVLEKSFTILNEGCTSLSGEVTAAGSGFSVVSGSSYSLTSGESAPVTVRFSAESCSPSSCTVTLGSEVCASVMCTAEVGGGACDVYPEALDFGRVAKNTEEIKSFWIRNTGCTEQEGQIQLDCPGYSLDSEPSWVLAPGESTEVRVRFSPVSCDDEAACFVDTGNPLAGAVSCAGKVGCGCWVSDEDRYHDYGTVDGDLQVNHTIDIKNFSCDNIILDVRLESGCPMVFRIKSGEGQVTLEPEAEHRVVVSFSPEEPKTYVCYLHLDDCGQIKLTGKGSDDDIPVPP